jgi:hypothetical protein
MAESVQAENGTSLAAVRPSWLAEGRQHRPIEPAAEWGRTLYSEKEIQESRRWYPKTNEDPNIPASSAIMLINSK